MVSQFWIGQTFLDRAGDDCDFGCVFTYTVTGRTDDTITVAFAGQALTKRVFVRDDVEHCNLLGAGSACKMCAKTTTLRARPIGVILTAPARQ